MYQIHFERSAISPGDCISNAWSLVQRNFWLYIGMGLITILLLTCLPLVNLFLMGPILGGFYYVVLKDMRNEPIEFGMLFKGFEKFVPLMVIGLIQALPGVIFQVLRFTLDLGQIFVNRGSSRGSSQFLNRIDSPDLAAAGISITIIIVGIIAMIIGIIWVIIFFFAIPLALEHDELGPIDAIKLSAKAAFANAGGIIVYYILAGLIGLLGVIALCLGYFIAIPVIYAGLAFAYRQVFPIIEREINYAPPPPSAYGGFGSFGNGQ